MKLLDLANRRLYIICFVNRSGSSYLCEMLCRAGLGYPQEYYHPYGHKERYEHWSKKLPEYGEKLPYTAEESAEEYFKALLDMQKPTAGIACTSGSYDQMHKEVGKILDQIKPKYIMLTRRDRLRQAISWYRAEYTGMWSTNHQSNNRIPPYSQDEIEQYLIQIEEQEQLLEKYIGHHKPLRITYEEIGPACINQICEFIGIKPPRPWNAYSVLRVQRDKMTEDWVNIAAEYFNDR